MQIIILTAPDFLPDEAQALASLLDHGLHRLHLRKPGCTEAQLESLIRSLPAEYYERISLHDHFPLQARYHLGGIHLNGRNPHVPQNFQGIVSRSCHSLEEVARYASQTDYHFLSPIFDSISKQGYRSGFDMAQLRQAACEGILTRKTIALGGVSADKLPLLRDIGFGGAAFLGDIWHDYRSAADLPALLSHFDRLMRICEEITSSDER